MSENSKSKAKSSDEKRSEKVMASYIVRPLLFVLISLIVIIPLSLGMLKIAVNTVHKAQSGLLITLNDISINTDSFTPSDKFSGTVALPEFTYCEKVGELSCEEKGLNTDVFYDINRVSLRSGAGISREAGMPGTGGAVEIKGDVSKGFKALENLKEGDMLVFQTSWGFYEYRVSAVEIAQEAPECEADEYLVLRTQSSKNAFACLDENKMFVVAELVSGPTAEEVLTDE